MGKKSFSPLRDEITKFLAEHPLSTGNDMAEALGRKKPNIYTTLADMFNGGLVIREKDEDNLYRYALKTGDTKEEPIDVEKDHGIETPIDEKDVVIRAKEYCVLCMEMSNLSNGISHFLKEHPNASAREIADATHHELFKVGGMLLYQNSREESRLIAQPDDDGTMRYSIGPKKEKLVKVKTLDDFTPRDIFAHLKKLGYKWKPQTLYHEKVTVERNFVEFDNI